jgi:hypothetical protein
MSIYIIKHRLYPRCRDPQCCVRRIHHRGSRSRQSPLAVVVVVVVVDSIARVAASVCSCTFDCTCAAVSRGGAVGSAATARFWRSGPDGRSGRLGGDGKSCTELSRQRAAMFGVQAGCPEPESGERETGRDRDWNMLHPHRGLSLGPSRTAGRLDRRMTSPAGSYFHWLSHCRLV